MLGHDPDPEAFLRPLRRGGMTGQTSLANNTACAEEKAAVTQAVRFVVGVLKGALLDVLG